MSNTIKLGNLNISSFKVGGSDCSIYLGTVKVYPVEFHGKLKATYSDGTSYSAACDGNTTLTTGTTRAHTTPYSAMTSAVVGDCVETINEISFAGCKSLSSCTISDSVTTIGKRSFMDCTHLPSVTIPNSVTSIGVEAFNGCSGLKSITIPSGVTSIAERTFSSCSILTSVTLSNSITSIGNSAFSSCGLLGSVTIPNSVTSIGTGAFSYCGSLQYVNIPSDITSIPKRMFYYCDWLHNVTIPNSVTSIGAEAFCLCSLSLTSIDIPNSVTTIGESSFKSCSALTAVNIGSGVTSIGANAFAFCNRLQSVTIPSGVTSIGEEAFRHCAGLTSVTCLATTPPTLGSNVFIGTNDCPIYVPCNSVEAYKTAWSTYASRITCDQPTPTAVKFSATYTGGTTYSAECDGSSELTTATTKPNDYQYTAMTSAVVGDCITSIGYDAFGSCNNLQSVTLPDGLTTIGFAAFSNCSGLTEVNIPSGVTLINTNSFFGCSGLTTVTIPALVTQINASAFEGCGNLQSITCLATTPPILGDNRVFMYTNDCPIYVPAESVDAYKSATTWRTYYSSRIQAIPTPPTFKFSATYSDGTSYSADCDGNTTLTTGTTMAHTTSYSAMTSAVIGDDCVETIDVNAFSGFTGLQSVTIPDSVTSIGQNGFRRCSGLTSVTIPSGVTSIGKQAFYSCTGLKSVTCLADTPPIMEMRVFDYTDCPIYVPSGSVNTYKADTEWSFYSDRIQAIPT